MNVLMLAKVLDLVLTAAEAGTTLYERTMAIRQQVAALDGRDPTEAEWAAWDAALDAATAELSTRADEARQELARREAE